ncbi:protein kinase domain-containing protein [Spirillospora sp. CA-294931]|uniref:protein kinase domain-containing protein n=1 Tax=Spirillospora sp. CA-294931 TaxID=3240042 RepID=UPI003D92A120
MEPLYAVDPRHVGPYRLEARLGSGGMGAVYLGRSRGRRPVAVKVVRPELADDATFRRRFATEITAARKVGGFYTAQVIDADPTANPPWMATAYIGGPSLHQVIEAHGPLPPAAADVLGAGLAEGLAAIHACDLVHRDLKPGNVIIAADGPRVIDFGIARAMDAASYTRPQSVIGTPAFMSPEQALGQEVSPASDVFSLGSVLMFAVTGHSPFGTGHPNAVISRVIHDPPGLAGLPAHLTALVTACLAKNPAARPTVSQILDHFAAPVHTAWLPSDIAAMVTERHAPAPPPQAPARTRPTEAKAEPGARATPAALDYAAENNIDLDRVKGTGRDGLILVQDAMHGPKKKTSEPWYDDWGMIAVAALIVLALIYFLTQR